MANGRFLPRIISQVTSETKWQRLRAIISLRACEISLSVRLSVSMEKKTHNPLKVCAWNFMLTQGKERLSSVSIGRAFPKFYTKQGSSKRTRRLP